MDTLSDLQQYRYRGARAMILMHEKAMREFVETWRKAKAVNVELPPTEDEDYASLETLLYHVFRAARGYMVWICDKLGLPDPQIMPPPPVEELDAKADEYLMHLNSRWRLPLMSVEEETMMRPSFRSRWNAEYCIEGMLGHALAHPMRHGFQLEEIMAHE